MANYGCLPTAIGRAKLAAAIINHTPVVLTTMAVGDGGGVAVVPASNQTTLVNEVYRRNINAQKIAPENPDTLIVELVVPADVGPFVVREVGVFDADGVLFAVAALPASTKPAPSEGASKDMVIQIAIKVADTTAVTVLVNPSVVVATRTWVEQHYLEHLATNAEALAANSHDKIMTPLRSGELVDARIAQIIDHSPATLDTLNEIAAALGDDPNFATTMTAELAKKAVKVDVDNALALKATKQELTAGLLTKLGKTEKAADSSKLGGFPASNYSVKKDITDLYTTIAIVNALPSDGFPALRLVDTGAASGRHVQEITNARHSVNNTTGRPIVLNVTGYVVVEHTYSYGGVTNIGYSINAGTTVVFPVADQGVGGNSRYNTTYFNFTLTVPANTARSFSFYSATSNGFPMYVAAGISQLEYAG